MKLTNSQIAEMYYGLKAIDAEQSTKLAGEVRMKVAINLNRLQPLAAAYERARAADIASVSEAAEGECAKTKERIASDQIEASLNLGAMEHEVEIKSVLQSELRLEDNPRITGTVLAAILPMIDGVA